MRTMQVTTPKLTADNGLLYLDGKLLLCIYPAGDCDAPSWPMGRSYSYTLAGEQNILARALFDARECRPDVFYSVVLPDGTEFKLDDHISPPAGTKLTKRDGR